MPERSPVWQAVRAVFISAIVLSVVLAAAWLIDMADGRLGHGPLPSGIDPSAVRLFTLMIAGAGLAAGGVMLLGVRQAKYFTPKFAWIVYVLVGLPLIVLLFVPLQRFGTDAFGGLPGFLVSVPERTVVGVALGALILGSIDLRRVVPALVDQSARVPRGVATTAVRGLPGRFTPNAWRAFSFMQEEATRFEHAYMGTEHLLLGLLRDGRCQASLVIVNLGARPSAIKSQLESIIGRRGSLYTGASGMTRRCQRVIEAAARLARTSGQRTVGTGHLLNALVEQPEDVAGQLLESSGVTADRVASELKHLGPEAE